MLGKLPHKSTARKIIVTNFPEIVGSVGPPLSASVGDSSFPELQGLIQSKSTREYLRGSVLFVEGEKARGVYLLREGRAKVFITAAEGKTLVLRVANPGEFLGINATLTGQAHYSTVKTLDRCQIDFIPREQFLKILDGDKRVYLELVKALCQELNYVVEHARLLFLSQSAAEKLARLLLTWCDDVGTSTPQGIRIDVRLTHEEMAQMICASRETVTRLLSDLNQQEILGLVSKTIVVRNRKALEAMTVTRKGS